MLFQDRESVAIRWNIYSADYYYYDDEYEGNCQIFCIAGVKYAAISYLHKDDGSLSTWVIADLRLGRQGPKFMYLEIKHPTEEDRATGMYACMVQQLINLKMPVPVRSLKSRKIELV